MYHVSNQFKDNIVKNTRKIKGYIDVHNTIHNFITCTLDDNIYSSETNTFIGSFIAKSGTIKIDYKDSLNLENGSFLLYFGIQLEDETTEYVPMGKMNVYEKISNTEYKFMDNRMYFNNHFDDTKISYPITVLDYLKSVCEQAGCELETASFPNSDFIISKRPFADGYIPIMSEIVTSIAQISCSFACINRDGNLELNWLTDIDQSYIAENLSSYPIVYEKYGPVNQVILSTQLENSSEEFEDEEIEENAINQEVIRQDEESIEANGITSLKIIDNPIANLDKDKIIVELWNRLKGFEYIPYNVSMQGQFHLDTGNMIDIETKDGSVINVIVMNHIMNYSGGISSSISAEAQSENQITYAQESSSNILMNQNFVKLNAEILNVSKKFTALSAKIDNLDVGNLEATYAKIDLSNVGTEYVDNLFVKSGVFEKVTGEEGIIYELTSVRFNGDLIKTNTVVADSLILTGLDGLYYRMNAEGGHLTQEQLSNEIYQKYLDGTNIVANSVTADKINVNKLSALTSDLGDIIGGSLNINNKFIVDNLGNMKSVNGEFSGKIDVLSGKIGGFLIKDNLLETDILKTIDGTLDRKQFILDTNKNVIFFRSYRPDSSDIEYGPGEELRISHKGFEMEHGMYGGKIDYYVSLDYESLGFDGDMCNASYSVNGIDIYDNSDMEAGSKSTTIDANKIITHGYIRTNSGLYTGGKTSAVDGKAGGALGTNGYLHLVADKSRNNPGISFYYDMATSATHQLTARQNDFYFNKPVTVNGVIRTNNTSAFGTYNSKGTAGNLIYCSNDDRVIIGTSATGIYGNTDIYAGNFMKFHANSNSSSYKATALELFREQSDNLRTILRPATNSGAYLGTTTYRFNTAFFTNNITASDLKEKEVIEDFDFKVKDFIMGLEPIAYRRKGQEDTGERIHIGLGAQTLASHIKNLNLGDLSMVQASIIDGGNEKSYHGEDIDDELLSWGINYTELTPYLILMIKEQQKKIDELERIVNNFEERLSKLEK